MATKRSAYAAFGGERRRPGRRPAKTPSPQPSTHSDSESELEELEWDDTFYKSEPEEEPLPSFASSLRRIAPATVRSTIPKTAKPNSAIDLDTDFKLCQEQKDALHLITEKRENVFLTGSAGCGKSTVIKRAVKHFRDIGEKVHLTAPTGRAAVEIGGKTTWSFAGWTPDSMKKTIEQLKSNIYQAHLLARFQDANVLIIDEISMVENWFLTRLDVILQEARHNDLAFGGLQVIVAGDFCQLPPVRPFQFCITCGKEMHIPKHGLYRCPAHGTFHNRDKWAFCSKTWANAKFHNVNLKQIHRQTDPNFIRILEKIRIGNDPSSGQKHLLEDHPCDVEGAVQLSAKRDAVRATNHDVFQRLKNPARKYHCVDHFVHNPAHTHLEFKGKRSINQTIFALDDEHPYESVLRLKQNMRIVLIQNISVARGLVNGAQGTITKFITHEEALQDLQTSRDDRPFYGTNDDKERLASDKLPIGPGADHIFLRREQVDKFMSDPRNKHKYLPVVRFDKAPTVKKQREKETIFPHCSVQSLADEEPYSLLCRTQIPLIQGDALTIHKSQGMTLDKVKVNCEGIWEEGQLYTGLSRARDLYGLEVENFEESTTISANREVIRFLKVTFPEMFV